jgi:hypothetical protein
VSDPDPRKPWDSAEVLDAFRTTWALFTAIQANDEDRINDILGATDDWVLMHGWDCVAARLFERLGTTLKPWNATAEATTARVRKPAPRHPRGRLMLELSTSFHPCLLSGGPVCRERDGSRLVFRHWFSIESIINTPGEQDHNTCGDRHHERAPPNVSAVELVSIYASGFAKHPQHSDDDADPYQGCGNSEDEKEPTKAAHAISLPTWSTAKV